MIPGRITPEMKSSGPERTVFSLLKDELGDDWTVIFSAGIVFSTDGDGPRDDESDFVLLHPDKGIVVLEVKAGVRSREGRWERLKPDGEWVPVRDPGTQATDHMHNLKRKLQDDLGWRANQIRIAKALVLTDVTLGELDLAPDLPHELVIDRAELAGGFAGSIDEVVSFHKGVRDRTKEVGQEGVEAVVELLVPDRILSPSLKDAFLYDEIEFKKLTQRQQDVVRNLPGKRRAIVYGCAGAGKTVIALQLARDAAARGKSVLYVCFNKALAEDVRARGLAEGVDAFHFHGLCIEMATRAGIKPRKSRDESYLEVSLPEALSTSIDRLGLKFDLLIIDEAQDFHELWFDVLLGATQADTGQVWLFRDDGQSLYDETFRVPNDFFPYELTTNCRNTQAIHREVIKHYKGNMELGIAGPEGRSVELVATPDPAEAVQEIIQNLVQEQGLHPADIVVLSFNNASRSKVAQSPGRYAYVSTRTNSPHEVLFSSIRSFKGLESPVVIACELDQEMFGKEAEMRYVAFSRARSMLYVVSEK